MGYRSQVRIVMSKNDYEDLKKQYYKGNKRDDLFYEKHEQCKSNEIDFIYQERNHGNIILFGWDWIKWYGDDCQFIIDFVHNLGEEQNKPCEMVAMGEDGATEEYMAKVIYDEGLENNYDIIHGDYELCVDEEIEDTDKLYQLEEELLHRRFENETELGKYISNFLGIDTPVKLFLDNQSDCEDERIDYEYDGEIKNKGELIADVYVWVLYDRHKQLYVTEVAFERA